MKSISNSNRDSGSNTGKVLVLGSDTRSFLSVVRSLGRYGLQVDAAWVAPASVALRSRYLNKVHDLPRPGEQPDDWLEPFNDLMRAQNYDMVVPCNDPTLIPLQRERHQLLGSDAIYLLDDRVFEITQSKVLSTQLAESVDILVPQNQVCNTVEQALEFVRGNRFPVVLKPTSSYRTQRLDRKQTVTIAQDEERLILAAKNYLKHAPIQIQEYFDGIGTGVEFLAKEGHILYAFQHQRLHEPKSGGGSSYRTSVPLHAEMLDATQKLIAKLKYSGIGMVEFRWNPETDQWIFVEINGRFWGSLPLAIASGADFPKFLYQSRVENIGSFSPHYRTGICCRNWLRDKNWFSEQRSHNSFFQFARKVASETATACWRSVTFRERSDTLALDDVKPAISETAYIARSMIGGARDRVRKKTSNSTLGKRLNRRRAAKAFESARRILFVCKGNICRSPFAEVYARAIFPSQMNIASSGYYPVVGRPSPEIAISTATQFGIDLNSHRSSVINSQAMEDHDIIFVFDDENWCTLRTTYPNHRDKIFLLGSFGPGDIFISDPYGGGSSEFHRIYRTIKESLDQLKQTSTSLHPQ